MTTPNGLREQARSSLATRASLFEQRTSIVEDRTLTEQEKNARLATVDAELDRLAEEVRSYIDRAETEEELRAIAARVNRNSHASLPRDDASRSFLSNDDNALVLPRLSEYRALDAGPFIDSPAGAAVIPSPISARIFDSLRLTSPVLSAVTVLPMSSGTLTVPVVTGVNASLVDEGQPIPASQPTVDAVTLVAVKGAALVKSTNEAFADASSDALRALVARDLIAAYGESVSDWLINGHTNENVSGLKDLAIPASVSSETFVERVSQAIAEMRATGLTPSSLMVSPAIWHSLTTESKNGGSDFLLGGNGAASQAGERATIFGVPVVVSAQCTEAYLLAGDRIVAGMRADFQLALDTGGVNFESDLVAVRIIGRFAGLRKTAPKAVLSVAAPAAPVAA